MTTWSLIGDTNNSEEHIASTMRVVARKVRNLIVLYSQFVSKVITWIHERERRIDFVTDLNGQGT
jgi:hypothetical protein